MPLACRVKLTEDVQTISSASRAKRLALGSWPGGSANATEPS